ncbi:hypothetical protein [Sediminicola sp. 1XM1-17]|uniref:hypothetical protein n=1 Tax=Sediminicola sp. 1XM1-17 TaxID=3127702 RepID=UPI003077AFE8
MRLIQVKLFIVFLLLCSQGWSQDCTLGIGGKDDETIIQVFQLNAEQVVKMKELGAKLEEEISPIELQSRQLLDTHPQSTPEELTELAVKFKVLENRIVQISLSYDQKLLGLFNQKQYQRYLELCHEVARTPLKAGTVPE